MIDSRKKLHFYLKADAIMNEQVFPHGWIKRLLFPSLIEKFLRTMRKLEYYDYVRKLNCIAILPFLYYRKKYEKLKERTGFDIPINTFGYGVRIAHLSPIIINGNTKIGNYCCLSNNIVIADATKKVIGDCVFIGSNVVIAKSISIADGCIISACTLQNQSISKKNCLWGGVISRHLKQCRPWIEQEPYYTEWKKCEELRKKMKIDD